MVNKNKTMFDFKDKKVLITGATGGIGKVLSESFAKFGAIVGLSGRDENKLTELAKNINGITQIFKTDLSDLNLMEGFIDDVDNKMGGLDILICNAGSTKDGLSMRMKTDDFVNIINVNLSSTFILNRDAAKKMIKRKYGRIINLSSIVGVIGNPGQANYCASKAGIIGMTKSIAQEYASREITINCIAPGFIKTSMTDVLTEEQKKSMLTRIPQGKFGEPQDIVNTALFLASDLASYITGQTIHVNGGMIMI
jgi:3-oxoacyl-[acyl-carrier protein] reductase